MGSLENIIYTEKFVGMSFSPSPKLSLYRYRLELTFCYNRLPTIQTTILVCNFVFLNLFNLFNFEALTVVAYPGGRGGEVLRVLKHPLKLGGIE